MAQEAFPTPKWYRCFLLRSLLTGVLGVSFVPSITGEKPFVFLFLFVKTEALHEA